MRVPASALALLVLLAVPALAGDDPPPYGASDLAIEEDGLAAPWSLVYEDVPGTPGEALVGWATQVAGTVGIEEDRLLTETRILKHEDGTGATLLFVEVDGDPGRLPAELEAKGKALGYVVRPLGHPTRLLVLAAAPAVQKALLDLETAYAIQTLSRLAWERLEAGSQVGAVQMAQGAKKIDAKAGPPMVVLAMALTLQESWDEAIEAFRAAFGPGTSMKPTGRLAMRGYAHYGYACLKKKDAAHDKEARDALEKSVALESHAKTDDPTFMQRYNLARAHARLKEKDKVLAQLEALLAQVHQRMGPDGLKAWIEAHPNKEEDFAALRDDPAWKAVIEKVLGAAGATSEEGL